MQQPPPSLPSHRGLMVLFATCSSAHSGPHVTRPSSRCWGPGGSRGGGRGNAVWGRVSGVTVGAAGCLS